MKILPLMLLALFIIGLAAIVKAETTCPPGQHLTSGRKYGQYCIANDPGAAPAAACVRHRVCKDGSCAMVCR